MKLGSERGQMALCSFARPHQRFDISSGASLSAIILTVAVLQTRRTSSSPAAFATWPPFGARWAAYQGSGAGVKATWCTSKRRTSALLLLSTYGTRTLGLRSDNANWGAGGA